MLGIYNDSTITTTQLQLNDNDLIIFNRKYGRLLKYYNREPNGPWSYMKTSLTINKLEINLSTQFFWFDSKNMLVVSEVQSGTVKIQ